MLGADYLKLPSSSARPDSFVLTGLSSSRPAGAGHEFVKAAHFVSSDGILVKERELPILKNLEELIPGNRLQAFFPRITWEIDPDDQRTPAL